MSRFGERREARGPVAASESSALRGLHAAWEALSAREALRRVPWSGDVPLDEQRAADALAALFAAPRRG